MCEYIGVHNLSCIICDVDVPIFQDWEKVDTFGGKNRAHSSS